jgi:hypothetical protein
VGAEEAAVVVAMMGGSDLRHVERGPLSGVRE